MHVFGGAGWWLVEYRTESSGVSAEAVTLASAVQEIKQRAALD